MTVEKTALVLGIARQMLAQLNQKLAIANGDGPAIRTRMNAFAKAAYEFTGGLEVRELQCGIYLVPSRTSTGAVYRVDANNGACSCQAGSSGAHCWHQAAAECIERARMATTTDEPGPPDYGVTWPTVDDLTREKELPETIVDMSDPGEPDATQSRPDDDDDYWDHLITDAERDMAPEAEVY